MSNQRRRRSLPRYLPPQPSRLLDEIEAIPIDIFDETFESYFQKVSRILKKRRKPEVLDAHD